MRWRFGAEASKLAHQVRLICVAVRQCQVCPREGWSHRRLLPRSRKASEPFKTFRCDAHDGEESAMKLAGPHAKFVGQSGYRYRFVCIEQLIDSPYDEFVAGPGVLEMFDEQVFDCEASPFGIGFRIFAKSPMHAQVQSL